MFDLLRHCEDEAGSIRAILDGYDGNLADECKKEEPATLEEQLERLDRHLEMLWKELTGIKERTRYISRKL